MPYIVKVRKKAFNEGAQRFVESDAFYQFDTEKMATSFSKLRSQNPMVVNVVVARIEHQYEKGVDIYGRDETES